MFRVEWLDTAMVELMTLWLQADSTLRQALTAASHQIDQRLSHDPANVGESRTAGFAESASSPSQRIASHARPASP